MSTSARLQRYYFDSAAATRLDPQVADAMHAAESIVGNPGSLHSEGRAAREALDTARADVARVLAARSDEIIFTSGSTESNNLAIFGVMTSVHRPNARVLTLATEHASVQRPMQVLREQGVEVTNVDLRPDGRIDLESFALALTDEVVLISIAAAMSETGILQPIAEIGRLVDEARTDRTERKVTTPLVFHTDAASAAGLQSLHVSRNGVDLVTFGASKIGGPAGIAALYMRTGTPLAPQMVGGGQERSLRPGTESVVLSVGLSKALGLAEANRKTEVARLQALRLALWDGIKDLPGILLNSPIRNSLANTLNVSFDGRDGEDLVLALDARGFAVATGAACAESSREPSHVLRALGRTSTEAQGSLRISLGQATESTSITELVKAIRGIILT